MNVSVSVLISESNVRTFFYLLAWFPHAVVHRWLFFQEFVGSVGVIRKFVDLTSGSLGAVPISQRVVPIRGCRGEERHISILMRAVRVN